MDTTLQRCNMRGNQCEKFYEGHTNDFCPHLKFNKVIGDAFSKMTQPPLRCPLKRGVYNLTQNSIDMSRIDFLPFDHQKWLVSLKFGEKDPNLKDDDDDEEERVLGCLFIQIYRTTVSFKRRGRNGK